MKILYRRNQTEYKNLEEVGKNLLFIVGLEYEVLPLFGLLLRNYIKRKSTYITMTCFYSWSDCQTYINSQSKEKKFFWVKKKSKWSIIIAVGYVQSHHEEVGQKISDLYRNICVLQRQMQSNRFNDVCSQLLRIYFSFCLLLLIVYWI